MHKKRFGFAYIPCQPGVHTVEISLWKVAANNYLDSLKTKFHTGGLTVSKSDLVYSGSERFVETITYNKTRFDSQEKFLVTDYHCYLHRRYKLLTISAGKINVELMIVCKNFSTFGIELK